MCASPRAEQIQTHQGRSLEAAASLLVHADGTVVGLTRVWTDRNSICSGACQICQWLNCSVATKDTIVEGHFHSRQIRVSEGLSFTCVGEFIPLDFGEEVTF